MRKTTSLRRTIAALLIPFGLLGCAIGEQPGGPLPDSEMIQAPGYSSEFRERVIRAVGREIIEEKPTRDPFYDLDFTNFEYADLETILLRAPEFRISAAERSLLQRMIGSPILSDLVTMVLIDHREIRDFRTAELWLGEHHLSGSCLLFLHSNMDMPQRDWLPHYLEYFRVTGEAMFPGKNHDVNAFMNLLWCRYGAELSDVLLAKYLLYLADYNAYAKEIEQMRFTSVEAYRGCASLSTEELVARILRERPASQALLEDALITSASCYFFLGSGEEQSPRSIYHSEADENDPYRLGTYFSLLESALAGMSPIRQRIFISRIRTSILRSLENATVPDPEWMWTINGYPYEFDPEIAESRHAYRVARTQKILERLADYTLEDREQIAPIE